MMIGREQEDEEAEGFFGLLGDEAVSKRGSKRALNREGERHKVNTRPWASKWWQVESRRSSKDAKRSSVLTINVRKKHEC